MKPNRFFIIWIIGFIGLFIFDLFIEGVVFEWLNGMEQQRTTGFLKFGGE